jgi:hypothetical protein
MTLTGEPAASYTIQVSSDLSTWLPLTNVVAGADGTAEFIDAAARRFYRAVEQ